MEGQNIWTSLHKSKDLWTNSGAKFDNSGIRFPFFKFWKTIYVESEFKLKRPCMIEGEINALKGLKGNFEAKECNMSLFHLCRRNIKGELNSLDFNSGYTISVSPKDGERKIICYLNGEVLETRTYEAKNYKKDKLHFKIEANEIDTKYYFEGDCIHTIPVSLSGHKFNEGYFMFDGTNRWISNVFAQ